MQNRSFMYWNSLTTTAVKHTHAVDEIHLYLIVVVHAGEVSPAFVTSDFN